MNAKYVLRYFASLNNNDFGETDVENKVLMSNPILEVIFYCNNV